MMKKGIHYLEYIYCHLLVCFLIGRVAFILNNRCVERLSFLDAAGACWRGFVGHDLMVAAFLLAVPWLVGLLALRRPRLSLRAWLTPYYIIMGFSVALITAADAVMFEFWQFKIGMIVLSYASSPEGTTNSVTLSYLLIRAVLLLLFTLWITIPSIRLTPKKLPNSTNDRLWMRNISIIWLFLLASGIFFMRQGDVYGNPKALLANHAAVNPTYAFFNSIRFSKDYADRYEFLSEADRSDLFEGLYPEPADDIQDTLLTSQRPDILLVFIEGMGARFIKELGGLPDVAPGWSRLIPEGIFWQNYYSNSFRTDRGTICAFSGLMSYPDICLMKRTEWHHAFSSLPHSLNRAGYETSYIYGGSTSNMGKGVYLENMGFKNIYSNGPVSTKKANEVSIIENLSQLGEMGSGWGLPDSVVLQQACHLVSQWKGGHHFLVAQTLSSHEPWTVPYHRLDDKILNAFAYTDYSIACMVDSLRQLPQWDNLLVILIPDHGFLYKQSYDPLFFRAPMLWTGGAIRGPRKMDILMNQSDIPATLLSQLGIRHDEFHWSRNVLSKTYTYPFVYSNWPTGLFFADSTGMSVYDIDGDAVMLEEPADDGLRILRAKAILQTSYDLLGEMRQAAKEAQKSDAPR